MKFSHLITYPLFVIAGTISAGSGNAILSFLVQAWNPADERIGTFTVGAGQQNLDCSSVNSVPAAVSVCPIASLLMERVGHSLVSSEKRFR